MCFTVDVLLKAAGDAPIMKKKKWAVDPSKTVAYLVEFIRKYIKCAPSDSLVSINIEKTRVKAVVITILTLPLVLFIMYDISFASIFFPLVLIC